MDPLKKRKVDDVPADPEEVKLLVDGKLFITTRTTLRQAGEDSFLGRLVSDTFTVPVRTQRGCIVINDRSSRRFVDILAYLRLGPHFVPPRSQAARDELWAEALFFGLPGLAKQVGRCRLLHISHKTLMQEAEDKLVLMRSNAAGLIRVAVSDLPHFFVSSSVGPRQEAIRKWCVGVWSCEDPLTEAKEHNASNSDIKTDESQTANTKIRTAAKVLPCSELTWRPNSLSFCVRDSGRDETAGPFICEGISPFGPLLRDVQHSPDVPCFALTILEKRPQLQMPPLPQRLSDALTLSEFSAVLENCNGLSLLEIWPEEALFIADVDATGPSQLEFHFPCRAQPVVQAAARFRSSSLERVVWIRWGNSRSCIAAFCLGRPRRLFPCEGRGLRSIGIHRVDQEASVVVNQADIAFLPLDGPVSSVSLSLTLASAGEAITLKLRP
jgi:hypothetical protein